jgi:hypothetical protein
VCLGQGLQRPWGSRFATGSDLNRRFSGILTFSRLYGIGWWAPPPGTSRRILISDQLYACTRSAADNLIEAALHRLEFQDFTAQESDRVANALTFQNGEPIVKVPRRNSPLEDVGTQLVRLHVAGTVRALSGALDCLAGTIIGVAAIPLSILRSDFGCNPQPSQHPQIRPKLRKLHLANWPAFGIRLSRATRTRAWSSPSASVRPTNSLVVSDAVTMRTRAQ